MLTISENKKFLEKDGAVFSYLADTAWTLTQRLTREEICFYLDCRTQQGFNAIQVSAISELDGIRVPNREGVLPFIDGNVRRPVAKYFDLVRFIADQCEQRGLVLVLLPYWGDKFNCKWGLGPEVFTPDNAAWYGKYLAGVIGNRENIIWMLGGDRPIDTAVHREIIDETARGIREAESTYHLMTYHPCGEASSVNYLRDSDYLDFHSLQSGHSFGGFRSDKMVSRTLKLGGKPCIDVECFYEDFPIDFDLSWNFRLSALDIRRRMYKNMLAGAAGHTYGHQSVWCFCKNTDEQYEYDWKTALNRPMAQQMKNITVLTKLIDITTMRPSNIAYRASSASGLNFEVIYLEGTEPVFVKFKRKEHFSKILCFNPESGEVNRLNDFNGQKLTLRSPTGHDAIIILYR